MTTFFKVKISEILHQDKVGNTVWWLIWSSYI